MGVKRIIRVNELLKREIGDSLYRVMTEGSVDLAVVTVTRVETSRDLKHARVMISVRDENPDRVMSELRRHRVEIQHRINTNIVLKRTPVLKFELDTSIQEGDKILQLLNKVVPSDDDETCSEDFPSQK